ncbi:hypothetical protein I3842_10G057500 [Carya illinoinensis]|uniref:Uncharacterized protein n=1 Tax=Carya illinoinensis TaxID=32201 RepID=A0A922DUT6_CARIL|nr:hypothetical protein I3842_10G057500 [Carya illinoinensis]
MIFWPVYETGAGPAPIHPASHMPLVSIKIVYD